MAWVAKHEFSVSLVAGPWSPCVLLWQKRIAGSVETGPAVPLATCISLTLTQCNPVMMAKVAVTSLLAAGLGCSLIARLEQLGALVCVLVADGKS